ncbi:MAG: putative enzyme related to lactoylglutathione lyase [Bryobacterales bacterium]|nr:putative enzyme related to lactoylglutathione lyase [Bryobacterales bacterium]
MPVKPIPDTSPRVIPVLVCRDPEAEIAFCQKVLKADVGVRRPGSDGTTIHAALILGEAHIIIQAEFPQLASRAPQTDGSSPVVIFVYVEDVDRAVEMTLDAGGSVLAPAQNQFWGDRSARVMDPSGHVWTIASRIEETSEDQRGQRWDDIKTGQAREGSTRATNFK